MPNLVLLVIPGIQTELQRFGVQFALQGDQLVYTPSPLPLPLQEAIKRNAPDIIAWLRMGVPIHVSPAVDPPMPYLTTKGELEVPFDCDSRYHYWKPGGQPLRATLAEVGAPAEVTQGYVQEKGGTH